MTTLSILKEELNAAYAKALKDLSIITEMECNTNTSISNASIYEVNESSIVDKERKKPFDFVSQVYVKSRKLERRESLPSQWDQLYSDALQPSSPSSDTNEPLLKRALRLRNRIQIIQKALMREDSKLCAITEGSIIEHVLDLEMRSIMIEERLKLFYTDPSSAPCNTANEIILFHETHATS